MQNLDFVAGRILVYPHGSMVINGDKTLVLSSRNWQQYIDEPVLLIESRHALGLIKLGPCREYTKEELAKPRLESRHKVTPQEMEEWWKDMPVLYGQDVEVLKRFARPIPVDIPSNAQVWLTPDSITFPEHWIFKFGKIWNEAWSRDEVSMETVLAALKEADKEWKDGASFGDLPSAILFLAWSDGQTDEAILGERSRALHYIISLPFEELSKAPTSGLVFLYDLLSGEPEEEDLVIFLDRIASILRSRGEDVHYKPDKLAFKAHLEVPSEKAESERQANLNQILHLFSKPARLFHHAVQIVGSLAEEGIGNDVDILVREEVGPENWRRIAFRLGRACGALPHVKFHILKDRGPFTSFIPLYDLALIPVQDQSVIEMQRIKQKPTRLDPMKPLKVGPNLPATFDRFVSLVSEEGFKGYVQPKFDGIHVFVVSDGSSKHLFTEDGEDITGIAPLDGLPEGDYTLDGELELWIDGEHQPREATAGAVHSRDTAKPYIIVFFDLLFHDDDITALPFSERLERLEQLCKELPILKGLPKERFYRSPSCLVEDEKSLRAACGDILKHDFVEGVVWKKYDGDYTPGRPSTGQQIKWHRNTIIEGVVLARYETKVPGVYNYAWGIEGKELPLGHDMVVRGKRYLVLGKTFSTKEKYNPGDEVEVEVEQFNLILEDGKVKASAWSPKLVRRR